MWIMFNSRTESLNFSNLKRNLDDIVKFFMKINYLFGFPTITAGILCNYTLYRVKICSLGAKPASLTRYNKKKKVGKGVAQCHRAGPNRTCKNTCVSLGKLFTNCTEIWNCFLLHRGGLITHSGLHHW